MSLILVQRALVMFLIAGLGFALFRAGKITLEGNRTIGNILIFLSLPAVIVRSLMVERTMENGLAIAEGTIVSLVLALISAIVARAVCRKDAVGTFAATFSNPGLFGIPLIVAALGQDAVFYAASFIAIMNLGQWTYGVSLLTGRREALGLRQVLFAPFMIAILIGLALFAAQPPLPMLVVDCLDFVAALNTPLAMIATGVYLAQVDLAEIVTKVGAYRTSLARLAITPLVSLLVLTLLPIPNYALRMTLLIAISTPVGFNVAVYAQLHNADYGYAVETVVVSVILSIVTIPLIVGLANLLWAAA